MLYLSFLLLDCSYWLWAVKKLQHDVRWRGHDPTSCHTVFVGRVTTLFLLSNSGIHLVLPQRADDRFSPLHVWVKQSGSSHSTFSTAHFECAEKLSNTTTIIRLKWNVSKQEAVVLCPSPAGHLQSRLVWSSPWNTVSWGTLPGPECSREPWSQSQRVHEPLHHHIRADYHLRFLQQQTVLVYYTMRQHGIWKEINQTYEINKEFELAGSRWLEITNSCFKHKHRLKEVQMCSVESTSKSLTSLQTWFPHRETVLLNNKICFVTKSWREEFGVYHEDFQSHVSIFNWFWGSKGDLSPDFRERLLEQDLCFWIQN